MIRLLIKGTESEAAAAALKRGIGLLNISRRQADIIAETSNDNYKKVVEWMNEVPAGQGLPRGALLWYKSLDGEREGKGAIASEPVND